VSKDIGETERNLARLFAEAEAAGAILLFDEADALFGKRSDVKDSHDRYQRIEIAYLLQRIATHDGLVILASKLRLTLLIALRRRLSVYDFPPP
jgi:SpoVK/Ycf46/Vps4 family AAA+-type ATPase